jgi:hypothetical protein
MSVHCGSSYLSTYNTASITLPLANYHTVQLQDNLVPCEFGLSLEMD